MNRNVRFFLGLFFLGSLCNSCKTEREAEDNSPQSLSTPFSTMHVSGTARRSTGSVLSDVALHVVYDIPGRAASKPRPPLDRNTNTGTLWVAGHGTDGVSIESPRVELPPNRNAVIITENKLLQNYPNPVEYTTTIPFDIIMSATVLLTIRPMEGSHIDTVVYGNHPAGHHEIRYDMTSLANGIYEYSIRSGTEYTETKILLKNASSEANLLQANPISVSNVHGDYSFDLGYQSPIVQTDELGRMLIETDLNRVTIVALKSGFQPFYQTVDLTGSGSIAVNPVLLQR